MTNIKRRNIARIGTLIVAGSLALAACGGGDDSDATTAPATTGAMADTTEGDDMADTTEGGDMADTTEGGDMADTTEGDAMADTTTADSAAGGDSAEGETVGVALILKNLSNPFFVSMADSAKAEASQMNIDLTVEAGQEDGDTDAQIKAIEAAVAKGDKGILITPSGDAVLPALKQAKEKGVYIIALDTPPSDPSAVDITFATDNTKAGELIGQWTAGTLNGDKATIAMLDLFNDQVVSVDTQRDQGFLMGMGIVDSVDASGNGKEPASGTYTMGSASGDYEIVCHEPTNGAADGGKTAMETCLAQNPDINVVYTINEPAAQGAEDALTAAGKTVGADGVHIVSVDGGCSPGLELVSEGIIGATAQQYPGKMATLGMEAIREYANTGQAPEVTDGLDFYNTGVSLVTDAPVDGVESIDVSEGQSLCWG